MFLVHIPESAKTLPGRVRHTVSLNYQGLFKPLTPDQAMWQQVSERIRAVKCMAVGDPVTSDDRRLMHEYAARYMHGTLQEPVAERDRQLACRARSIVNSERNSYRRLHPIRGRRTAVAA